MPQASTAFNQKRRHAGPRAASAQSEAMERGAGSSLFMAVPWRFHTQDRTPASKRRNVHRKAHTLPSLFDDIPDLLQVERPDLRIGLVRTQVKAVLLDLSIYELPAQVTLKISPTVLPKLSHRMYSDMRIQFSYQIPASDTNQAKSDTESDANRRFEMKLRQS
jgi:hypothetical protein